MGIWCYTCKVINTKLFSSVGVAPRSHLSRAWVLIIPLKLTELHLLSNIPLISEDSQDLIPKGKFCNSDIEENHSGVCTYWTPWRMSLFWWYFTQITNRTFNFNSFWDKLLLSEQRIVYPNNHIFFKYVKWFSNRWVFLYFLSFSL